MPNANGYMTDAERIVHNMEQSKRRYHNSLKDLRENETRTTKLEKELEASRNSKPSYEKEVQEAKTSLDAALEIYTRAPWMNIQVKLDEPPALKAA